MIICLSSGFWSGLIDEFFSFCTFILTIILISRPNFNFVDLADLYSFFDYLMSKFLISKINYHLYFFYILFFIALKIISFWMVRGLSVMLNIFPVLKIINRSLGLIFGFCKGLFATVFLISIYELNDFRIPVIEKSYFFSRVKSHNTFFCDISKEIIKPYL
jgi:hypothetical protein